MRAGGLRMWTRTPRCTPLGVGRGRVQAQLDLDLAEVQCRTQATESRGTRLGAGLWWQALLCLNFLQSCGASEPGIWLLPLGSLLLRRRPVRDTDPILRRRNIFVEDLQVEALVRARQQAHPISLFPEAMQQGLAGRAATRLIHGFSLCCRGRWSSHRLLSS